MNEEVIEIIDKDAVAPLCGISEKGLIINPGALGDCILTLPLAEFMLKMLGIKSIDFAGQPGYTGFFPGRTCINKIRPIDSIDFYRLFVDHDEFALQEKDTLPFSFCGYDWIVSFLGEKDSDFEKNLILTVYSMHSAEISILPIFQNDISNYQISEFYIKRFIEENNLEAPEFRLNLNSQLIKPIQADLQWSRQILASTGVTLDEKIVIIQPGSGGRQKCWHLDNYLQIAADLKKSGFLPIFLLGPAENDRLTPQQIKKIQSACKTFSSLNIKQAFQLIAASSAYIGNDSGTTHLAAAAGIKTTAIFGPTCCRTYRPIGPQVSIITPDPESFTGFSENSVNQVKQAVLEQQCEARAPR